MSKDNFFIVIEGLDGVGKTYISNLLVRSLRASLGDSKVKITNEPHEQSCAGIYIRQVLAKQINTTSKLLATAFASNRLDHCHRDIEPFLNDKRTKNRVVICDRYYLSSLVYQSQNEITMNYIWELNRGSLSPELILFLDASNKICRERMKVRAQDRELFEKNIGETRQKYYDAIDFLEKKEEFEGKIVPIKSDGSVEDVYNKISDVFSKYGPEWLVIQRPLFDYNVFSLNFSFR